MTEKQVWDYLKKKLPWDCDKMRVENYVQTGVPDTNLCYNGTEVWVELKVIVGNRFQSPFKPIQAAWLHRRTLAGGRCFVGGMGNDAFKLWSGRDALKLKEKGPSKVDPFFILPKPINKDLLLSCLFGRTIG